MIHGTNDKQYTNLINPTRVKLPHLDEYEIAQEWATKAGSSIHDTPSPIVTNWSK
jgi:hypothetical protein